MPGTPESARTRIRSAFRSVWAAAGSFQKGTTGARNDISVGTVTATHAVLTRAAGSFITDVLDPGDEVTLSGFLAAANANNGIAYAEEVTDTTMKVRKSGMAVEAAGAPVTVKAVIPQGLALELRTYKPTPGQPWVRERLQLNAGQRKSIGVNALVRYEGVYWLTPFYPGKPEGTPGLERFAGQLEKLFRQNEQFTYDGQLVTLRGACGPKDFIIPEADWNSLPCVFYFYADVLNPE